MAIIIGSDPGGEILLGTAQDDVIAALDGNDTIFGQGGLDEILGFGGSDLILGQSGHDPMNGGSGNDSLYGGTGNDMALGGTGNDRLAVEVGFSSFGTDVLAGDNGFDIIAFETASAIEINGSPAQAVVRPASRGVVVNLVNLFTPGNISDFGQTQLDADGEVVIDISAPLRGRILDRTSLGSGSFGPNGVLDVLDSESAVFADVEKFELTGFADYFLDSAASHIIEGGGGNDFISGGGGSDILDGGEGNDTALYRFSAAAVSISLLDFGNGGSGSGGEAQGDKLFSIENVSGSEFNDTVIGDGNANVVSGFGGNDVAFGGNGNDTLSGGNGSDNLIGGADADVLSGGLDGDTLNGGTGNDQLNGDAGSDTALFQTWNSAPLGGLVRGSITLADGSLAGAAVLTRTFFGFPPITVEIERDGLRSIENVVSSDFNESITGNSANNLLDVRGGGDVLNGRLGADTLLGGDGDDRLIGGPGSSLLVPFGTAPDFDLLDGGNGVDAADYAGNVGSVVVALGLAGADGQTREFVPIAPGSPVETAGSIDVLRSIENVIGSGHGDAITGNEGDNSLLGLAGNDNLSGGAGNDTLSGGTQNDTAAGGLGSDNITGGDGEDSLLGNGEADVIDGGEGADAVNGGAGPDTLFGGAGDDTVLGGGGADVLNGGLGNDRTNGGGGSDTYQYALGDGADRILDAGGAADLLVVGSFADIASSVRVGNKLVLTFIDGGEVSIVDHFLAANRIENVADASGQTVVLAAGNIGGGAGGIISGTRRADYLNGKGGDDFLFGAGGDDVLLGGAGGDQLRGGTGDDTVLGGRGSDVFILAAGDGQDVFYDFTTEVDSIAFDRDSFGFAAAADVADVVTIGGAAPVAGASIYIFDGAIVFDADWSDTAGRETLALVATGDPAIGDIILI